MSELERLAARCAGGVRVMLNPHLGESCSIVEYFARMEWFRRIPEPPPEGVEAWKMLVVVRAYPDTPVGFHEAYAQTLDEAVAEAHRLLDSATIDRMKKPK